MIKDCETCIHNRGGINCGLKPKYNDYKLEMEQLIEKWGENNGFGFSLDCPSWYEEPSKIKVTNDVKGINDWFEKEKNIIFKAEDINIKPMEIKFGKELECTCCIENENVKDRNVDWVIALPEEILKSVRDGKYMNH